MNGGDFDEMVQRFFDNELPPKDFALLQRALATSAEARHRYRQLAETHSLLVNLLVPPGARHAAVSARSGQATAARKRKKRIVTTLAAAAVLAFAVLTLQTLWLRAQRPLLTFRSAPGSLVEINHAASTPPAVGSHVANAMFAGSHLVLRQGVVELKFASGVTGYVSGPADLSLVSRSQLRLDEGTARFRVPPGEAGFKVTTSGLEVVDLGTEFGVVAPRSGEGAQVHVFRGKVTAEPTGGTPEHLVAGLARRVEPAGSHLWEIPVNASLFHQSLPDSLPFLHWSFDEVGRQGFQVDGNHPAVAGLSTVPVQSDGRAATTRLVSGVKGRALSFDGTGDHVETNWPGIDGNKPRTAVMWVRFPKGALPRFDAGGIVWGTRVTPDDPVCWKFNFMASAPTPNRHLASPPVAVAYVTFGRWWRYGTTNVADGKWHCIAVTYSGGIGQDGQPDVRLYVDGAGESSQSVDQRKTNRDQPPWIDTKIDHPRSSPLFMGRSQERLQSADGVPYRYFAGEMDELYIFEGVLNPDEIRRLSETARFDGGR